MAKRRLPEGFENIIITLPSDVKKKLRIRAAKAGTFLKIYLQDIIMKSAKGRE